MGWVCVDFVVYHSHTCLECDDVAQDFFCIARGTLFDNPSIRTLSPLSVEHSVHCLIDGMCPVWPHFFGFLLGVSVCSYSHCIFVSLSTSVRQCINSDFEILLPPLEEGGDFVRGWRLDADSKSAIVALAKREGNCDDCDGGGTTDRGFHVTFSATIVDLGNADTPPTVKLEGEATTSVSGDLSCPGGTARPPPFKPAAPEFGLDQCEQFLVPGLNHLCKRLP